jgi:NuA3 HAT complex component NTO1
LDKNVFQHGLNDLQSKLDDRFYTTTLAFAHDLCEVINVGINTKPELPHDEKNPFESQDVSPTKQVYADIRERKRLGKRILKAVQPQLESALQTESTITHRDFNALLKELEGMLEASLELSQPSITVSHGNDGAVKPSHDVIMVDAPSESQITVANDVNGKAATNGVASSPDAMDTVEDDDYDEEDEEDEDEDEDEDDDEEEEEEEEDDSNIEVNTSGLATTNGVQSSSASVDDNATVGKTIVKDDKTSETPPATNGYVTIEHHPQTEPPTPPQSNGSLGKGPAALLMEGGVPWYLKSFEPLGTTIVEPQWRGLEAIRSLSEELTDMDDDELKGLGLDVAGDTITASPVGAETIADTIVSAAGKSKASKVKKRARASTRRR